MLSGASGLWRGCGHHGFVLYLRDRRMGPQHYGLKAQPGVSPVGASDIRLAASAAGRGSMTALSAVVDPSIGVPAQAALRQRDMRAAF
jgi:hypothetical protein